MAWPLKLPATIVLALALGMAGVSSAGCRKDVKSKQSSQDGGFTPPPGDRAGAMDAAALARVRAIATDKPPAAIRPDPDLYVRRLLRQYRDEGPLVAREIGRVEEFRLLLGGASEDFRQPPQESFDATSLLAMQKVAEEICVSLVAPNGNEHPGWNSILPSAPASVRGNILFLAQRFLGVPSSRVPADVVADLVALTQATANQGAGLEQNSYVPACVALSTDAEALLL